MTGIRPLPRASQATGSPVPVGHPLHGVYQKLRRAQDHQEDLARHLDSVFAPGQQHYWMEPDPANGCHALRVRGVPQVDPQWQCVMGDCLHNLRSALDHLAWQLVILDGQAPMRSTYFPIRDKARKEPLLKPVLNRQDLIEALDATQPYSLGDGSPATVHRHPLLMLNKLSNIDKHRLPLVLVTIPSPHEMWWGWSGHGQAPAFKINWAKISDGSPVGWFDFHGVDPPPEFNPHPALQVSLNETSLPFLTGLPLANVLQTMIMWVEDNVVEYTFRPLFD